MNITVAFTASLGSFATPFNPGFFYRFYVSPLVTTKRHLVYTAKPRNCVYWSKSQKPEKRDEKSFTVTDSWPDCQLRASSANRLPAAMIWFPFSGIGLFGLVFATPAAETESRRTLLKRAAIAGAVLLIAVLLLMAVGCSSGMTNHTATSSAPANLLVTGTSGSIQHSVQVALTVN